MGIPEIKRDGVWTDENMNDAPVMTRRRKARCWRNAQDMLASVTVALHASGELTTLVSLELQSIQRALDGRMTEFDKRRLEEWRSQ